METRNVPFKVECSNCGSHNVEVAAFDYLDLSFHCKNCSSYINIGYYNELEYNAGNKEVIA